jgi:hypothetical protein
MMKVILIRVIKGKVINIVLKNEMVQLFWDIFFFANGSVIMGRKEYYLFEILAPHVPKVWIRPWLQYE